MDENQDKEKESGGKPEKKMSRTTLTFYIIGLFLFALALIFISYISQVQSDKELEDLSSKLNEQQTVAQGFSQKVEEMQRQLDEQTSLIDAAKAAVDVKSNDELLNAIEALQKQTDLQERLSQLQYAAYKADWKTAAEVLQTIETDFSAEELTTEGGLLSETEVRIMQEIKQLRSETPENQ